MARLGVGFDHVVRQLRAAGFAVAFVLAAPLGAAHAAEVHADLLGLYADAARRGSPAEVEALLLKLGPTNVDLVLGAPDFHTALTLAIAENPDRRIALLLLRRGASAKRLPNAGHTPLALAAAKGDTALVRELARRGAIDPWRDDGGEALKDSANAETSRLLLELGAEPSRGLLRAYCEAAKHGSVAEVAALLTKIGRERVDAQSDEYGTPLMLAIRENPDPAVAKLLLDHGASPVGPGHSDGPMTLAVTKGDAGLVRELARYGALEKAEDRGSAALERATTREMARLLLELGAVPNPPRAPGEAPLVAYARSLTSGARDLSPVVFALLDAGADVRATDPAFGTTALHQAATQNRVDVASALLDRGADVNAREIDGGTPLSSAVAAGCPPEPTVNDRGRGHQALITLLLERGADPNLGTTEDHTPLAGAVTSPTITRLLLDAGADPRRRGWRGTPLDKAENREVEDMLVRAGGGDAIQERLHRLGLSPNLWNRTARRARAAAPYSGILAPPVLSVAFLAAFVVSSRLRRDPRWRAHAVGAAFMILAVPVYAFAVAFALVRAFDWVAGKILAAALPAVTAGAWLVAWWAYRAGRRWYGATS